MTIFYISLNLQILLFLRRIASFIIKNQFSNVVSTKLNIARRMHLQFIRPMTAAIKTHLNHPLSPPLSTSTTRPQSKSIRSFRTTIDLEKTPTSRHGRHRRRTQYMGTEVGVFGASLLLPPPRVCSHASLCVKRYHGV